MRRSGHPDFRGRARALLQAWGDRIQYSAFLCTIGEEQADPLVEDYAP